MSVLSDQIGENWAVLMKNTLATPVLGLILTASKPVHLIKNVRPLKTAPCLIIHIYWDNFYIY